MVIFLTSRTTGNGTLIGAVSFDVWLVISRAALMDFVLRKGSISAWDLFISATPCHVIPQMRGKPTGSEPLVTSEEAGMFKRKVSALTVYVTSLRFWR